MTTRALLKATIMDDMHRTSAADGTRVLNEISTAIKFYQPRPFFFNESRSVTFNTVASTDTYAFGTAITTEFYKVAGVWITIAAGDVRELDHEHPEDIEEWADEDTTTGEPSAYAYINKSLRLWRSPDAIYSMRLMGHVKAAEPATDAETGNPWMTEAYELIRCRAKYALALHAWKDMDLAERMKLGMSDALASLMSATADKLGTGYITPTEF